MMMMMTMMMTMLRRMLTRSKDQSRYSRYRAVLTNDILKAKIRGIDADAMQPSVPRIVLRQKFEMCDAHCVLMSTHRRSKLYKYSNLYLTVIYPSIQNIKHIYMFTIYGFV